MNRAKKIAIIKLRKEKAVINTELDLLTAISDSITSLREIDDRDSFFLNMREILSKIGKLFNVEYCSIGLVEGEEIYDVIIWTNTELSDEKNKLLSKVKRGALDNTLIGSYLSKKNSMSWTTPYLEWNKFREPSISEYLRSYGLKIDAEKFNNYKSILRSKEVFYFLVKGFFSKTNGSSLPIGYLHIINKFNPDQTFDFDGLNEREIAILNSITGAIETSLNNYLLYDELKKERSDDVFFNALTSNLLKVKPSQIYHKILEYLAIQFSSDLLTMRVPVYEEVPSDLPDDLENIKLVLSERYYNPAKKESIVKMEEDLQSNLIRGFLDYFPDYWKSEKRIIEELNNCGVVEIDIQSTKLNKNAWTTNRDSYQNKMLFVPIFNLVVDKIESDWFKNLSAVIFIKPLTTTYGIKSKIRLLNISRSLSLIFQNLLYQKLDHSIQTFKNGIQSLSFEVEDELFRGLAGLLNASIGSQHCSILLENSNETHLVLRGTTAIEAYSLDESNCKIKVKASELIRKEIYSLREDGLTRNAFIRKKPIILASLQNVNSNGHFIEVTGNSNHPVIITPIFNSNNKAIGVVKFVDKNPNDGLVNAFVNSEKDFAKLLVGVIPKFIENAEFNIARKSFIQQLIHEIKLPLHQIKLYTSYQRLTFENRIGVIDLDNETQLLTYIIEDLELLYKTNHEEIKFQFENSDAVTSIDHVIDMLKGSAKDNSSVSIIFNHRGYKTIDVSIDVLRFRQALINLIKNAVKYSRKNNVVEIEYNRRFDFSIEGQKNTSWHEFDIKNWGIGVESTDKDKIFDLYYRGENARSNNPSGSGIGLFVVKRIIEGHRGIIRLKQLDNPTVFSIYLPINK